MKSNHPFAIATEEARRYGALLQAEVLTWPDTRCKKMFGMISLYRGDAIFALLPATKSFTHPSAIGIKMQCESGQEKNKWSAFHIRSDKDIVSALRQLQAAYDTATK